MNLAEKLHHYIEKWDIISLSREVEKEENILWIENNAWDLVPILIEPASKHNLQKCPQVVQACSQILAKSVAKHGKPKEIIISLLEQCEHSDCPIKFR